MRLRRLIEKGSDVEARFENTWLFRYTSHHGVLTAGCHRLQGASTFVRASQIVEISAWLLSLQEQLLNLIVKSRAEVKCAIASKSTSIYTCIGVGISLRRIVRFNVPGQVVQHRGVNADFCLFCAHLLAYLVLVCGWRYFCRVHDGNEEGVIFVLHLCVFKVHLTVASLQSSYWSLRVVHDFTRGVVESVSILVFSLSFLLDA